MTDNSKLQVSSHCYLNVHFTTISSQRPRQEVTLLKIRCFWMNNQNSLARERQFERIGFYTFQVKIIRAVFCISKLQKYGASVILVLCLFFVFACLENLVSLLRKTLLSSLWSWSILAWCYLTGFVLSLEVQSTVFHMLSKNSLRSKLQP